MTLLLDPDTASAVTDPPERLARQYLVYLTGPLPAPLLPEIADPTTFGGPFTNHAPVVDLTWRTWISFLPELPQRAGGHAQSHGAAGVRCAARCPAIVVTVADHGAVVGQHVRRQAQATLRRDGELPVRDGQRPTTTCRTHAESHAVSLRCAHASGFRIVRRIVSNKMTVRRSGRRGHGLRHAGSAASKLDQFTVTVW